MHPDKVPLAFGIKIDPHHHTPSTTPRDWNGVKLIVYLWALIQKRFGGVG